MDKIELTLKWDSKRKLPVKKMHYSNREYRFTLGDSGADLRVFDATGWDTFDEAVRNYTVANIPALIIAHDGTVHKWLEILPPDQEVCPADDFEELFPFLICRLSYRNFQGALLLRRSLVDPLTGAFNREEFDRRFELEVDSATPERPVSLILLDLDNFKNVNDTFGHEAGDTVLRQTGKIMSGALSGEARVYRFGGEEFILPVRMSSTQAGALAEFIRKEIAEYTFVFENETIQVTASLGVATATAPIQPGELVQQADTAMYQAKAGGRNQVVEYEKYADGLSKDSIDPEIQDFENRIRVLTERLTSALTARSRKIVTQYKREAEFDGLTGLHIRRYFDKRIRRDVETARKKDRALSLIFIDLDDFGQVNKEYGFPTGDQTLRLVASTILESIRDTDWAARYGGEELCIVLPDTDEKNALKIAERVWKRIKKEKISTDDNREFFVTASLGVAELLPSDIDAGDFIQRTSDRTRTAKKNGKDRICIDDTEAILEEE